MALHSHITSTNLSPTPSQFSQAMNSPHGQQAMREEFAALQANQTWTRCPQPTHKNFITHKWVSKVKQKANVTHDRFKARLMARRTNGWDWLRGYLQSHGLSPQP